MPQTPHHARDIMTTKLVTLTPTMDVFHAIDLLIKHQISGAPVVDPEGNYIGVFTEKSCLSVLVKGAYDRHPTGQIFPFIDTDAMTIEEDTDLLQIAQIFSTTQARRLPVLRGNRLVGQISRCDALRAVYQLMQLPEVHEQPLLYLSSLREHGDSPLKLV